MLNALASTNILLIFKIMVSPNLYASSSLDTAVVGEAKKRLLLSGRGHRAQADFVPIRVPMHHVEL